MLHPRHHPEGHGRQPLGVGGVREPGREGAGEGGALHAEDDARRGGGEDLPPLLRRLLLRPLQPLPRRRFRRRLLPLLLRLPFAAEQEVAQPRRLQQ